GVEDPVELDGRKRAEGKRPGRRAPAPSLAGGALGTQPAQDLAGVGEAADRLLEVVGAVAGGDDGVQESSEDALHHGDEEVLSPLEVDVERATRVTGTPADPLEARAVEAMGGELSEGGVDQGLTRMALGLGA